MKKVLTVQDISCLGKCSLTVALPIISACGVETVILPTAVLSTHTAFSGFTFRDLTDDLTSILSHWKKENVSFDAIYTGYLGSKRQISIVADAFKQFKTDDNFILVDPAMADNGKLYKGFDENFAKEMASLCSAADYIVPNLTEASYMLGIPYREEYDEKHIRDVLVSLTALGAKTAVITGVSFDKSHIGVYAYDSVKREYYMYFRDYLKESFHGTGDIFASALTGALTLKKPLMEALKIATDFTFNSIDLTIKNPKHDWYGVEFERAFPSLIEAINK